MSSVLGVLLAEPWLTAASLQPEIPDNLDWATTSRWLWEGWLCHWEKPSDRSAGESSQVWGTKETKLLIFTQTWALNLQPDQVTHLLTLTVSHASSYSVIPFRKQQVHKNGKETMCYVFDHLCVCVCCLDGCVRVSRGWWRRSSRGSSAPCAPVGLYSHQLPAGGAAPTGCCLTAPLYSSAASVEDHDTPLRNPQE